MASDFTRILQQWCVAAMLLMVLAGPSANAGETSSHPQSTGFVETVLGQAAPLPQLDNYVVPSGAELPRTWTDATGAHHAVATLVGVNAKDSIVRLRKADGAIVRVSIARLSDDDRKYVEGRPPASEKNSMPPARKSQAAATALVRLASLNNLQEELPTGDAPQVAVQRGAPRYAYDGCNGTFHLVWGWGTAAYWLHHQYHVELLYWKPHADPIYWHYQEYAVHGYQWAFAKKPFSHGCGCHYGYPVWYRKGENQPWQFFGYLSRKAPTHTH